MSKVLSDKYISSKTDGYIGKSVNVVDLINKVKVEEKKQKRFTIIVAIVTLSVVIISAFIISL